jgi:hypothetical protein
VEFRCAARREGVCASAWGDERLRPNGWHPRCPRLRATYVHSGRSDADTYAEHRTSIWRTYLRHTAVAPNWRGGRQCPGLAKANT